MYGWNILNKSNVCRQMTMKNTHPIYLQWITAENGLPCILPKKIKWWETVFLSLCTTGVYFEQCMD